MLGVSGGFLRQCFIFRLHKAKFYKSYMFPAIFALIVLNLLPKTFIINLLILDKILKG